MDMSLDLYIDYLICSTSYTTVTGLLQLTDNIISHDKVTRFLSSKEFTAVDLWKKVKPFYKSSEQEDGVLIIDDSIEEKPYTDENEVVTWHWDHKGNKSTKGINFATSLYESSKGSAPIALKKQNLYRST